MKRSINKVAVLGSGIMGSRIACHFANIGVEVLLLDIAPKELSPEEQAKGLTLDNPAVKNRIVNTALQTAVKTNPSPVYSKKALNKIKTGNFDDDMPKIAGYDWVIEVVVENLDIKKKVFEQVEQFRKPGTLITSNTSGIPIHLMAEGRTDDFKSHFCGTHFFNPPRYLKLLEVIPTPHTQPEIVDFLMHYGDKFLGKTTVLCKDTPAFIANRVGVYSIMALLHLVEKLDLTVEEVDKFTGPALGRPKSATFRTSDVVGLDTMIKVAKGLYDNCPDDKAHDLFKLPVYVQKMEENKWLGDKTKQGFYKKTKTADGKTEILALDLKTLEYKPQQKVKSATLEMTKPVENLRERMKIFAKGKDKAGELFRHSSFGLFEYVSDRIPEISDELYRIDDAMRAGFGWELGPFELWDAVGVKEAIEGMEQYGNKAAAWVHEMLDAGNTSFYKVENGVKKYYDIPSKSYKALPGTDEFIILDNLRENKTLWKNSGVSIIDLGDGILNVEFHTKMNTIGGDVISGINKAIDMAEKDYRGLVIGNDGANFSAGANVGMIFMMAVEQEWDELNMAIRMFQNTSMRIRYSSIPVVVAPHNLTLGGGCEFSLHADHVQLSAETYMGLVEFGVGVIPGGGGTKEFALRASDEYKDDQIVQNALKDRFLTIGMAKVSTSGYEAYELGYLQKDKFSISMNRNRLLADAKAKAIELADAGYTKPVQRNDIKVLGKQGLGIVYAGANSMYAGHFISEHDKKISEKLGYVMCGGDLSAPTDVTEQYLLDLEREAFLSLAGERKSLERIQSIITKGKPLRN
ncbi:putative 3-hydroxyacyl-CoA dehydrogenase [Pedobacter sp. Bi27]|uniref:3-hydroxyacyl-CoA dehydrogenase/enoyl-CoA hydratase family protein n=1 Tax=unclassified Pedobacter TaxID=2628915 RepID=UPI001DFBE39B|nr:MULTISPECIES: 3-hydroxyacyl-CoA dehydrogenase/enoyl-CoA hydratase family protein [unclassified Pedobacter]CAH0227118.1 putative 3-hydroxyacyl-CoA dehydrogenase [Pedobacter sp. Bi27]CAH0240257.1 putative 3-hydroxyacyl-CoA dehydrogenase [Pedobacter sp. Bi36]CAH0266336.1 putative 3-hydroxyacyl-CoA dehydrogenase [Pedobacter sp. Bi126]